MIRKPMAEEPAQLQLAVLMFTDIVNSVSLQKKLGTALYTRYITRHDEIFKACLSQAPGARILNETGDGFLVRLNSSSDAVNTALRLQYRLHSEICEGQPMALRIGLHSGEITEMPEGLRGETRAVGMAINLAARIMDLAAEGQILMTRAVFDDARQFTRSYPDIDGIDSDELPPLLWPAYGRYIFKGNDEPMEIYGVGAEGITPLVRPEGSEKAKRAVAADEEATLGWRPGAGLAIPRREDWVIERKIGEGGFGEVWLAENKKSRMARVFKFCFDPDRLRSFKRELTLFRLLRDALGSRRDIAALYEVSVEAPPYYLESEYVPTGNIAEWFASKGGIDKVPLNTRLQIMAKAARAAAAAHSVGIIHKDIKPSNILISEENGIPEPRLSDFGIGTLADTSRLGSMGITSDGFTESVILESEGSQSFTHLYAPPEYLVGKPASVRGDIYSLGVMLYQLAVGDLNSPLGTGWRRGIEDSLLADDIRRCVDVDPERRFQSASHLAEHLEQLDSRHAEHAEEQRIEGLKQNARRRKRTTILTVSVACGLALLTALLALGYIEQKEAKNDADIQRKHAEEAKNDADIQRRHAEKATEQLRTQAGRSDFLLAGQLLARDQRSEALVYLAQAIKRDPRDIKAGRKLMATLAMSRFIPLKVPPIQTLQPTAEQTLSSRANDRYRRQPARDVSPDGTLLAALAQGEHDEELRVWNLSISTSASEQLEWEATTPSDRVIDIAFATNKLIGFVTQGDDRQATLHIWEKTPQWAWVRSDSIGVVDGFGGFLANGAFWVSERWLDRPDGRKGRLRSPSELVFHNLISGNTTTLPAPGGSIRALDGFVENSNLSAMIAVHEMGPDVRVISAWSTKFAVPTISRSGPDNNTVVEPDQRRRPRRGRPSDFDNWRTYARGSSWSGPPMTIAVSPNGRIAAVPEPDGSVRIWSLEDFNEQAEPLASIQKANDLVAGLRFSPDSRKLAVGYLGGSAIVYEIESGSKSLGPLMHEGGVMGMAFSHEGLQLLTRSLDHTARLWDTMTGVPLSEPMRHESYVVNGFMSSDGKSAVTISYDGVTKAWNLEGGSAQGENLPARDGRMFSAVTPDLKTTFSTAEVTGDSGAPIGHEGHFNTIRQRVAQGKPLSVGARFSGSRFTSNGRTLIAVRIDGTVTLRDIVTGSEEEFRLGEPAQRVQLRAISGDGSTIAIATQDRSQRRSRFALSVWRRAKASYQPVAGIPSNKENTDAALSHDGRRMVTSHGQLLEVWELNDEGAYVGQAIDRMAVSTALAMTGDGTRFIVGTAEGTLQYWSFEGNALTRPLKQSDPVIAVALAADNVTAAAATASLDGGESARVQVWDLDSQETLAPPLRFFGGRQTTSTEVEQWRSLSGISSQVVFSPNVSQVLLHYSGDTVIWDLTPDFEGETVPDIVPKLATAIGGFEFHTPQEPSTQMEVLSPVPYGKFTQLASERSESERGSLREPTQVQRWLDWLIAKPETRGISPTSDVTNQAFTDYLVEQGTIASLHEAMLRNPDDHRITTAYFSELLAQSESSGATVTAEEATWFAEKSTEFLDAEATSRHSGPEAGNRHQDVADALSIVWRFRRPDLDLAGYFRDALKTSFAPGLGSSPDDLSLWLTTGQTLLRSGLFIREQQGDPALAKSCLQAALLILSLLAEEEYSEAAASLLEVVESLDETPLLKQSDDEQLRQRERQRPPRRRDQEREARSFIATIPHLGLAAAIETNELIPKLLKETLRFYLDEPPTMISPHAEDSTHWMHRAFVQSSFGNNSIALESADRALKIGVGDRQRWRKIHRLRSKLLRFQGDLDAAQQALANANGILQKPADASAQMVDLTPFFSSRLQRIQSQHQRSTPRSIELPSFAIAEGLLDTPQGISFDARGIVFPMGTGRDRNPFVFPEALRPPVGIPIEQKARQLHFLHGAIIPGREDSNSTVIGEYVIRYEDDSSIRVPIHTRVDVGNWKPAPNEISDVPEAYAPEGSGDLQIAWSGPVDDSMDFSNSQLFLMTWDNPKPMLDIKAVDFVVSSNRSGHPFLVAVTVQP